MPARNAIKEGIAYDVELGASFRGGVATHHTLRYSFKPPTADYTQRGRVSINGAAVEIKVPTKSSSPVVFRGKNDAHRSSECLLVCRGGKWTLERLDKSMRELRAEREEAPR